jgi:hypothetical protein
MKIHAKQMDAASSAPGKADMEEVGMEEHLEEEVPMEEEAAIEERVVEEGAAA